METSKIVMVNLGYGWEMGLEVEDFGEQKGMESLENKVQVGKVKKQGKRPSWGPGAIRLCHRNGWETVNLSRFITVGRLTPQVVILCGFHWPDS